MLFDLNNGNFESNRERNMYFKFFGGYFFNELIVGFPARLESFAGLLRGKVTEHAMELNRPILEMELHQASTHLSFDNHARLFGWTEDEGEFADMFLHDRPSRVAVPIEVKFFTDPNVNKDVVQNLARIDYLKALMPGTAFIPTLLIREQTLQNLRLHQNQGGSFWRAYEEQYHARLIILTWEGILDLCDANAPAVQFVRRQLARNPNANFTVQDEGFGPPMPLPAQPHNLLGQGQVPMPCPWGDNVTPARERQLDMHLRVHLDPVKARRLAAKMYGAADDGQCILDPAHGPIPPESRVNHLVDVDGISRQASVRVVENYWGN